ncbi:MAG: hypothetical protein M1814_000963 [Vezdaea aestivalis]|nr:MAG: hypothetical protein M1814_000963 [Vezdaea aestivalis]
MVLTNPVPLVESFFVASAVKQLDPNTYSCNLSRNWCIGSVPHGGYVTGTLLRAATTHFRTTLSSQHQPDPLTLHLSFLRRTSTGPASIKVQPVKLGRQTSTIHLALSQAGRDLVVGYVTFTNFDDATGVSLPTGWALEPAPARPPQNAEDLEADRDAAWVFRAEHPFAVLRYVGKQARFWVPRGGQPARSISDEWLGFTTGEGVTVEGLGFAADMWDQVVEAYRGARPVADEEGFEAPTGALWYPTVTLNLDFKKRLPEEGERMVFVRARAKKIHMGQFDLEVVMMDLKGEVICLSNHVAFAVGAERNLAERGGGRSSRSSSSSSSKL